MKESFRVWFIFEITCYSLPVCLAAGITLKVLSFDMPLHVLTFLIVFFISCCGSVYAVSKLMLYVFGNKPIELPQLIGLLLFFWLLCWLTAGYMGSGGANIYMRFAFFIPILVVLHLGYIANDRVKSNT